MVRRHLDVRNCRRTAENRFVEVARPHHDDWSGLYNQKHLQIYCMMDYLIEEADLVVILALLPVLVAEAGGAVVLQRVLQQAWLLATHPAQLRLLPAEGQQGTWGHDRHYSWTDHH